MKEYYVFGVFALTALLFTASSGMLTQASAIPQSSMIIDYYQQQYNLVSSLNEQSVNEIDRDWVIDTAQALVLNGLNDGVIDEQQLLSLQSDSDLEQITDTAQALVLNGLNDGTIDEQQLSLQSGSNLEQLFDTAQTLVLNGLNDGVIVDEQQLLSLQEGVSSGHGGASGSYAGGFVHVSGGGYAGGFVLILVLFILLVIIGAGFGYGGSVG